MSYLTQRLRVKNSLSIRTGKLERRADSRVNDNFGFKCGVFMRLAGSGPSARNRHQVWTSREELPTAEAMKAGGRADKAEKEDQGKT